jgi:hypothetical protein
MGWRTRVLTVETKCDEILRELCFDNCKPLLYETRLSRAGCDARILLDFNNVEHCVPFECFCSVECPFQAVGDEETGSYPDKVVTGFGRRNVELMNR